MSRLYLRLLLWFCIANVLTLLISVFLTERLTRHAYGVEPDWPALAAQAGRRSSSLKHKCPAISWPSLQGKWGHSTAFTSSPSGSRV